MIYEEYGLKWKSIAMDDGGIHMKSLQDSGADIIHVSPEHHYPLGTVMSASRRQELLSWASEKEERYIIEVIMTANSAIVPGLFPHLGAWTPTKA